MKPTVPVLLGVLFLLAFAAAVFAVNAPGFSVTARDSQGVEFVLVREASPHEDGEVFDAELWQRVGAVGPAHPFYLRRLTPAGSPPMFARVQ